MFLLLPLLTTFLLLTLNSVGTQQKFPVTIQLQTIDGPRVFEEVLPFKLYPDTFTVVIKSEVYNATYHVTRNENAVQSEFPVYVIRDRKKVRVEFSTGNVRCYRGNHEECGIVVTLWRENNKSLMIDSIVQCTSITYDVEIKRNDAKHSFITKYDKTDDISKKETPSDFLEISTQPDIKNARKRRSPDISVMSDEHSRYVEVYFVGDNSFYKSMDSSIAKSTAKIIEIVNGVDTLYQPINIRVILVGVEIWDQVDQVNIDQSATHTLSNISKYSESIKNIDNLQLITVKKFDKNIQGLGYVGGMCSLKYSSAINSWRAHKPLSHIVTVIAHEMGHNFYMRHDVPVNCTCPSDNPSYCIMESVNRLPSPKHWTNCSVNSMKKFLAGGYGMCLSNLPNVNLGMIGKCGNNIVEGDEECDCGGKEYCNNDCCDASSCKLKANAQCATGPCCNSCKLYTTGTVCRPSHDECDILDTCDVTGRCSNAVKENGTPCDEGRGACREGKCKSRRMGCRYVWGGGAQDGIVNCYTGLNTAGKYYGHCGEGPNKTFTACESKDVYCGLLQCTSLVKTKPVIGRYKRSSVATIQAKGMLHRCVGVSVDLGRQHNDPGMVHDWTPCGANKHCMNAKCLPHVYKSKCTSCKGTNHTCTNDGLCIDITAKMSSSLPKPTLTSATTVITTSSKRSVTVASSRSEKGNSDTQTFLSIFNLIFCQVFGIIVASINQ